MKKVALIVAIAFISVWSFSALAQVNDEYEKGLNYYNAGQFEEAVKTLKGYVEKNPRASAYYLIGYSLYKLGRHDDAEEYFREAYLIDTEFSPTQFFEEEIKERFIKKETEGVPEPSVQPEIQPAPEPAEEMRPGVLSLPPITPKTVAPTETETVLDEPVVEAEEPEIPVVAPEEPVPAEKPQPEITFQPPKDFTEKMPEMPMGFKGLAGVIALMSGAFGLLIQIGLYIFFALCLFRIGNKLDVPNSWVAWIPILNSFWPLVGAGGQTVKWGLIYLIGLPLLAALIGGLFSMISPMLAMVVMLVIGLVVFGLYIWLWMNVSENLGKERLLGLLMILPFINLIYMGYLAFSEKG
ncbi:tetratricopeptide repeat protein [bacterium]|nr:MAG: tetratricopeptide repeat protein [bacterium]